MGESIDINVCKAGESVGGNERSNKTTSTEVADGEDNLITAVAFGEVGYEERRCEEG